MNTSLCLISFPKSGRTWLRMMLNELNVHGHYDHAGAAHRLARHWSTLDERSSDYPDMTNLPNRFGLILVLTRDPRDTVVSGFQQATKRLKEPYPGSLSEFIRDPHHGIEKCVRFNRLWTEFATSSPSAMLITYEQMHADAADVLRNILQFIGEERAAPQIATTVARHRFEVLQDREIRGDFDRTARIGAKKPNDPNSLKCRRGKIGSFREEMSCEDIAYCDSALAALATM